MKFVYPTEIPASVEDDFKHLKGASNRTGFYPIGRMNTWHGGIHIEGDKKIKAIADGIVLAYRVPKVYFEETIDNKISRYSNGFVLMQHNYESPNGQKMTFYSLYNHLASYEELKAGKIPDLFKGQAYKVKNTAKDSREVKGATIKSTRGTGGSVLAYAAKGTILTFLEDANDNSRRKVKYTTPNGKEIIGYTWVKKLDDKQLVNNETGEVLTERFSGSDGDLGANLRKEGNSPSEVKQLIPRGTTVRVADEDQGKTGWLKITKVGDEEVEGYCHTDGLEGTDILVLKEEDSDKVVNCCIKVQAGDIIGFTGLNGFEKQEEYRGAHIEVFTPDEVGNFLNNELKDGENNKNFAKLAEGTELKKAFPCKVIKNSRLKLLTESANYQKVEIINIDVTVNDRNAALGAYSSTTNTYEFLAEHTDKLSVFNALVGDIAVIGDKVKLVEQLSGSVRKVRHINPQNGLVCWVKKEDVEKKTITTTTSSSETNQIANATTTTNNAVTSQPISQSSEVVAVDMSSGNQMNNAQMVPPASSAVNTGVVETPISAQLSATETLTQQEVSPITTTTTNNNTTSAQADSNSQTTSTSEIVDVLNKEISEVYLINPEQEDGIQKLEADTIINIREGKELTDKDNKKWYLISPTGFQKNGMSVTYKGLIKESDLGDTFSAYKWSQFGFEVKEDADNKYVYDFKNKPAFLSAIIEIADTDGNGILEPLELQRAIKNHYTYDKLSHVVAKHINEWAYSGQYLTPLMDEVTEVLDKGIELEDDDDIKKDLETLKKERLDAFEAKVKQLALWEGIESKKESYKSIFVNGILLTNPVTAIPYLEYKACRWIYNKLTSSDEDEQQIPLSPFPIKQPVVYHFHPIAFVEQMRRVFENRAPWMTIVIGEAITYKDINESTEPLSSTIKNSYHTYTGHPNASSATSWCASFVSWCLGEAGFKNPKTWSSQAFIDHSTLIKVDHKYGAVAIFTDCDEDGNTLYNEDGYSFGHVCFVIGALNNGKHACIGGNQGDRIKVSQYDCSYNVFPTNTAKTKFRKLSGLYYPKEYQSSFIDNLNCDDNYTDINDANNKILNSNVETVEYESV